MAMTIIFNGMNLRVPGASYLTPDQIANIKLRNFLQKLGVTWTH